MNKKYCEICGKELPRAAGDAHFCSACISRANVRIKPNTNKGEISMKEYIKLGFGAYVGWTLARVTRKIVGKALGFKPEKTQREAAEPDKD